MLYYYTHDNNIIINTCVLHLSVAPRVVRPHTIIGEIIIRNKLYNKVIIIYELHNIIVSV